ncbi:MAG: hypothetical protein SGCHY_005032 [Lobulomycetales sp.]
MPTTDELKAERVLLTGLVPEETLHRLKDKLLLQPDLQPTANDDDMATLTTKYYSVDLVLHVRPAFPGKALLADDALVLVVDRSDRNTLDALPSELTTPPANDALRVCLGMCTDTSDVELDNDTLLEWCIDHGLEYIDMLEAPATSSDLLEAPEMSSSSGRPESVGLARLVESLSVHAWSSLTLRADDPAGVLVQEFQDILLQPRHADTDAQDHDALLEDALAKIQLARQLGQSMADEDRRQLASRFAEAVLALE